ncbi:MAG TPA: DUF983 domain-containing protein [Acidimicrobiales bacterium]|nr:DUF983 domain-containing protein [Acidimicrobiales bacterium]
MLWRGLWRRCPRCAERKVFRNRFRLVERCPQCGLLFEREEGFFLGAYVINFGVGEGLVGVILMVFLFAKVNNPDLALAPWLIAGIVIGVVAPIVFFPNSRTIWAAFDLAMNREASDVESDSWPPST